MLLYSCYQQYLLPLLRSIHEKDEREEEKEGKKEEGKKEKRRRRRRIRELEKEFPSSLSLPTCIELLYLLLLFNQKYIEKETSYLYIKSKIISEGKRNRDIGKK